ncbi:WAT1-related protein [Abeliophyllum distichum]|uniref:WAT1-related protein n=1 Tax=Abeliophyllum distichum TaxID=126358 RepID=A0ABD1STR8_9LAMI
MVSLRYRGMNMEKNKPYLVMIFIQFVYAGMALFSKAAITQGMNPYVFVVYRQALASMALAPIAFFMERSTKAPPLSCILLCKIFLVSSCGITMSLDLYYFGLNYVSATFAAAFTNTIPAITFILAVCFRMESLSIKQRHGMAKVLGSAIGISGALLCSFVRGPPMYAENKTKILNLSEKHYSKADWLKGSLVMLAANITWSLWLIMQGPLIKQYPAKLRLTALQCFCSCASSAIWAVVKERSPESWKLGWNLNLLSVFYCGVIVTGFTYWLQVWVVEKKGPVFTSVFSPLALILTAIFSAILFKETLHWGSVCGAIMLIIGLYAILWGKNNERKAERSAEKPENNEERTLDGII